MFIFKYKKLYFLFLIIAFAFTASAQQDHFVYLQTDNGKPFYIKINKKILSSSFEGYVIIPNVTNGVYQFKVGFPKNEYPEEEFALTINDKNEGYLIKHFDDNGLQLFNLETLALVSGSHETTNVAVAMPDSAKNEVNPFTQMLANVVKDSSILQNHQAVLENIPKSVDTSLANTTISSSETSNKTDSLNGGNNASSTATNPVDSAVANTAEILPVSKTDSSVIIVGKSPVSKLLSMQNEDGWQMMYADSSDNKLDTVLVYIPLEKNQPAANSEPTKKDNFDSAAKKKSDNSVADSSGSTITPTGVKPDTEKTGFVLRNDTVSVDNNSAGKTAPEQIFYIGPKKNETTSENSSLPEKSTLITDVKITDSSRKDSKEDQSSDSQLVLMPKVVTSSEVNSDCKAFADNEDFLRLRKKMAAENSKEEMIKVAKRFFRSKCYSTEQIKNLSYLFLTDEGKYMFFDAAYAFTSDSDQYSILISQLKDDYYRNRLKAMIRK
ncbi:MAG: DUF4476 domain-containing protein [Ginsengibacter sp.]